MSFPIAAQNSTDPVAGCRTHLFHLRGSRASPHITINIAYNHATNVTLTSGISSGTFPIHVKERMAQSHLALVLRSKCKCIANWSFTNHSNMKSLKPSECRFVQSQRTEQYKLDFTWQGLGTANNRLIYDILSRSYQLHTNIVASSHSHCIRWCNLSVYVIKSITKYNYLNQIA